MMLKGNALRTVFFIGLAFQAACWIGGAAARGDARNQAVLSSRLYKAIEAGNISTARSLVQQGVAINRPIKNGDTPLMVARTYNRADMIKMLLEHGANADTRNPNGDTVLILASQSGQAEIADLLLKGGADINATGYLRMTPLMIAAQMGNTEMVKLLLRRGANVNYKASDGNTALKEASRKAAAFKKLARGAMTRNRRNAEAIVAVLKKAGAKR